jgi:hypothetical protein
MLFSHQAEGEPAVSRPFIATFLLGSAAVIATACAVEPTHDIQLEVTGTTRSAAAIDYAVPGGGDGVRNATLPWTKRVVGDIGQVSLDATPTTGTLTCRILVDGTEIARVTGGAGTVARCSKIVDGK